MAYLGGFLLDLDRIMNYSYSVCLLSLFFADEMFCVNTSALLRRRDVWLN